MWELLALTLFVVVLVLAWRLASLRRSVRDLADAAEARAPFFMGHGAVLQRSHHLARLLRAHNDLVAQHAQISRQEKGYLAQIEATLEMCIRDSYQLGFSVQFSENKKIGFHGNVPQDQVYFFRVRTVEQNGIVTSALYGKINSGLCITPQHAKNCYVGLYYYLNPTPNDRNIEYGSTLFKNLEFLETPRAP